MLQYIRAHYTALYLTDANGNPTQHDLLDPNGVSLLTGAAPTFLPPNTFAANQWSLAAGSEPAQIVINISVLPANNGSPITAIQYRVGNAPWVTLPDAVTDAYPVTMAATSTAYDISLRAVNIVGPSAQSTAKTVTSGAPAATAPAAFGPAQWSLATGTEPASLTLNILSLPADGGSAITAIEYRIGSGEWVALTDAETGPRSITMPQGSTSYSVTIRAVNAVNAGPAATAKTATSAAPAQQAPSIQTSPTISGSTTVGSILTRTAGTATGNPTPTRATVWLRNGEVIPGQTGNTLDTSGFAADDVITTDDVWTNSQGTASGTSAAWTLTVQPSITATIDLQPAGQQSSITFNVVIDGSPTIAQGSTSITATRVGTTNQWTFTAPVEGPISFAATKAGYTAFSDATRTVAPALSSIQVEKIGTTPVLASIVGDPGTEPVDITTTTYGAKSYQMGDALYADGPIWLEKPVITRDGNVLTRSRPGLPSWLRSQAPVERGNLWWYGPNTGNLTRVPGDTGDLPIITIDPAVVGGNNVYAQDWISDANGVEVPILSDPIAIAAVAGAGVFPTFSPGDSTITAGAISGPDANGDLTITSGPGNTTGNPRVKMDLSEGITYEVDTRLEFGNASRIIGRLSNNYGDTGTSIFDVTKEAGQTVLSRTDQIIPTSAYRHFHYVFVMNAAGSAKILSTTRRRTI